VQAHLKLDFEPKAYAEPLTEQEAARFRGCGYSDDNIVAILGGNFRRLLGTTWT
jgi:microsomal dipeptidase-like Zn-dependent dipeptidase